MTLSSTVMSRNGLTIWNVRAIPASATWSGRMDDTSRTVEPDLPERGPQKARQHAEKRRLASAVGADDAQYPVGIGVEGYAVDRHQPAKPDTDVFHVQHVRTPPGCAGGKARGLAVDAPMQQLADDAAREHQQDHDEEQAVDHLRQRRHGGRAERAADRDQRLLDDDHHDAAQKRPQGGAPSSSTAPMTMNRVMDSDRS